MNWGGAKWTIAMPIEHIVKKEMLLGKMTANMYMMRYYISLHGFIYLCAEFFATFQIILMGWY